MNTKKILWQKESKHKNALYTNICVSNGCGKQLNEIYHDVRAEINAHKEMKWLYVKSNKVAKDKRELALNSFHNRDWNDAIDWFNESLCSAEIGSKQVGMAYAYRSACFFNLKWHEKCLVDIELAKNHNYPKHLIADLDKRKESCLVQITQQKQNEKFDNLQLQSHLRAHGYFTGSSDSIELKVQGDRYSIEAKRNIDVGEIVAVDKAFTKTLYTIYGWKCNICLKSNTNLVPCKRCTTAMFCRECEKNDLHKYECCMKTSLYSTFNNYLMRELRTFLVAMTLFGSADEMMDFVEQSLADTEMFTNFDDDRMRYKTFLKMGKNSLHTDDKQFAQIVFCVYKILLDIPEIQNMFVLKKHRRFLMHIIGHHIRINVRQSYTARITATDEYGEKHDRSLYAQVGLMLGFIAYSCAPNVWPVDRDGDTIYIALRPISAGDQLTVNYYGFHWDVTGLLGYKEKNHQCSCELYANHHSSTSQIEALLSDPDFQYVSSHGFELDDQTIDCKKFYMLKKMCRNILRKFGSTFWCLELRLLLETYSKLITIEFNGTMTVCDKRSNNNNA